jgi:hypothetical protein
VSYFFCEWCRTAYRTSEDWSEEHALAERAQMFGSPKQPDDGTLCDDCYQLLLKRMARAKA